MARGYGNGSFLLESLCTTDLIQEARDDLFPDHSHTAVLGSKREVILVSRVPLLRRDFAEGAEAVDEVVEKPSGLTRLDL